MLRIILILNILLVSFTGLCFGVPISNNFESSGTQVTPIASPVPSLKDPNERYARFYCYARTGKPGGIFQLPSYECQIHDKGPLDPDEMDKCIKAFQDVVVPGVSYVCYVCYTIETDANGNETCVKVESD